MWEGHSWGQYSEMKELRLQSQTSSISRDHDGKGGLNVDLPSTLYTLSPLCYKEKNTAPASQEPQDWWEWARSLLCRAWDEGLSEVMHSGASEHFKSYCFITGNWWSPRHIKESKRWCRVLPFRFESYVWTPWGPFLKCSLYSLTVEGERESTFLTKSFNAQGRAQHTEVLRPQVYFGGV